MEVSFVWGLKAFTVAQDKWYVLKNLPFKAKNKRTSSLEYVLYPRKIELSSSTITNL